MRPNERPRLRRLSKSEKDYILKYYKDKSPAELAKYTGRTVEFIEQWIKNNTQPITLATDQFTLRTSPKWKILQGQFDADELREYERLYLKYLEQFGEDLVATEETQIDHLVQTELFRYRLMTRRRLFIDRQKNLEKLIQERMRAEEFDAIPQLENQLHSAQNMERDATKDVGDLEKKHQSLLEDLKATRKQRQTETKGASFLGLIKQLQKEEMVEREAKQKALFERASTAEFVRLASEHKYADGQIDRPILNADTVGFDNKEEVKETPHA